MNKFHFFESYVIPGDENCGFVTISMFKDIKEGLEGGSVGKVLLCKHKGLRLYFQHFYKRWVWPHSLKLGQS